ncbi:penicillin-binding protein 1C [Pseudophaeobacter flagellatus]|uniref:penicillin-binding protein 1C n=1 Tax=Pseudophaeobacter flagellatus TaxID=2899119 RepID=UPI001E4917CD|nr:penicillin-binding protein 1C [Pseudophaeobacter flagellatus]MCD9147383.1 penicillin-binding protein 1C [Pseudophaeobacter flagellatus]
MSIGLRGLDRWVADTVLPVTLAETSTEVLDRNGDLLRVYPVGTGIWRMAPQLEQVDPRFIAMLTAYEDQRFQSHAGVDPLALLRALGQALWHGRTVSGGSTLTMQLARLLEDGTTGAWAGKIRQMRLALALERHLSKNQILALYLTHAPYGGNLEGIRAASYAWFGRAPNRLTPSQAALLIALPQSPERRRPDRAPAAAQAARDRVLDRLAQAGLLTGAEVAMASQAPLPSVMRPFPRLAPHLSDRLLATRPGAARLALTLDGQVQAKMEQLVAEAATRAGARISAALLAVDHQTGEIIASVGSPAYADSARQGFVDMTQALRSPGSTLKPLVYGMAFEAGLVHPESLIHDGPIDFDGYAPQNFDGVFRGDVRVRQALQLSLNIPVVRLTREIGPAQVLARLRRGGAQPQLPADGKPGLAISLGGIGTSLQDLVQVYAGIAAGGQGVALRSDQTVAPDPLPRLLSKVAAWQLGDILREMAPPAGARAGVLAYKTGTSYGHRDAWAIGWDGRHVIGVWLGRADGTPVPGAFGGDLAAPLLFEAFGRLKPEMTPFAPPPAATLMVGAAELPLPLRRFRPRDAVFDAAADAPQLLFPPDGAHLALEGGPLVVKLRGGLAPFALLADGRVLTKGQRRREFEVPNPGQGFSSLVVVDSAGQSARAGVEIDAPGL